MPAAANLRDLHSLHDQARTIRNLLESYPKTLTARQAVLENRRAALEKARKENKEGKAQSKSKETQIGGIKAKVDDLRVKLNTTRKQDEYNALVNQIQTDNKNIARLEDEVLQAMEAQEQEAKSIAALDAEVKSLEAEVDRLKADLETRIAAQQAQLAELEATIATAEDVIPDEQRDQYRRLLKQRGADAMAQVEDGSCHGCFVSLPPQMINELMNANSLVFCKTCGRILYLAETTQHNTRRR